MQPPARPRLPVQHPGGDPHPAHRGEHRHLQPAGGGHRHLSRTFHHELMASFAMVEFNSWQHASGWMLNMFHGCVNSIGDRNLGSITDNKLAESSSGQDRFGLIIMGTEHQPRVPRPLNDPEPGGQTLHDDGRAAVVQVSGDMC